MNLKLKNKVWKRKFWLGQSRKTIRKQKIIINWCWNEGLRSKLIYKFTKPYEK